jgi:hypothetical protein
MQISRVRVAMYGWADQHTNHPRALILYMSFPTPRPVHYFIIDLLYITLSGEYRTGIDVEGYSVLNIVLLHRLSHIRALQSLINYLRCSISFNLMHRNS